MTELFVYGTLMHPKVAEAIVGRRVAMIDDARLGNYRKYAVQRPGREQKGPGLVEEKGASAHGRIISGLSKVEIAVLDRFEGSDYRRVDVWPMTFMGVHKSQVYLGSGFDPSHLVGEWSFEEFERDHLHFYLEERIPKIRRELGLDFS